MKTLVLLFIFTSGAFATFKFEPHNETTGIIFDHVNNITFIEEFKYAQFEVDFSETIMDSKTINESIYAIDNICSRMESNDDCKHFRKFIEMSVRSIDIKYRNVYSLGNRSQNMVTAVVALTTIMAKIFTDISTEKENLSELHKLNKEHIRISGENIKLTAQTIENHANVLKNLSSDIGKLINLRKEDELKINLNKVVGLTTLSIFTHFQIADSLVSILKNQTATRIAELVDPDLILKTFYAMKKKSNRDSLLANQGDINDILNIIDSSERTTKFVNNILYVNLKVPITGPMTKLYRLHRVPIVRGKEVAIIDNVSPFIAKNGLYPYAGFTHEDLKRCKRSVQDVWMCIIPQLTYNVPCENEIMARNTSYHCKFVQMPPANYAIRIRDNNFYCVVINAFEIKFKSLSNKIENFKVNESGWLTIDEEGIAEIMDRQYIIEMNCFYRVCGEKVEIKIPNLSLPSWKNLTTEMPVNFTQPIIVIEDFDREFKNLTAKIEKLKEQSEKPLALPVDFTPILIGVLIVSILGIIIRCVIKFCWSK